MTKPKNLWTLTTRLTAGECLDRLRRISKRDDGQAYDQSESVFAPASLLLAKTPEGFTLRSRWRGSLPLEPVLEVRFEPGPVAEGGTRLVAGFGVTPGDRTIVRIGIVCGFAVLGLVSWSALRERDGYITAVPLIACALAAIATTLLLRRARWSRECPPLLQTVRTAVDSDEWRPI